MLDIMFGTAHSSRALAVIVPEVVQPDRHL